jgi:hypothetical protein
MMLAFLTKQGRSRSSFESGLAGLVDTARAHEQNNLPAGHDYYKLLYKDAVQATVDFCNGNTGLTVPKMFANYPALEVMRNLAEPPVQQASKSSIGVATIVIGALLMLVPVVFSLYKAYSHTVSHWFGV